jgi:predicted MFS family arabinose efflux permease
VGSSAYPVTVSELTGADRDTVYAEQVRRLPGFGEYAQKTEGIPGFGVPRVIVALVAGSLLLAGYVVHVLRAEDPLIDLRLFGGKSFSSSVVTMFLLGGMLFALLFLLPLFYQQVRGHGVFVAGLLVMPLGLGLFGTPIAGKIADRFGPRLLVPMGAALIGLGALLYTGADTATSQVLLTAALLVVGFGMSLVGPPTMGSVYRTVPAESVGTATGAVFILNQIGASLGIAVVALIVQHALDVLPRQVGRGCVTTRCEPA